MSDEIIQKKDLSEEDKEQAIVDLEQTDTSSEILSSAPTVTEEIKTVETTETKPQETNSPAEINPLENKIEPVVGVVVSDSEQTNVSSEIVNSIPALAEATEIKSQDIFSTEINPIENKTEPIVNVTVPELEKTDVSPEIIDSTSVKIEETKIVENIEAKTKEIDHSSIQVSPTENKTEPIVNVVVPNYVEAKKDPAVQIETSIKVKGETAIQPEKPAQIENSPIIQKEISKAVNISVSKDILLIESFKANMLRAKELLIKARFAIQIKKKKKMDKIMTLFVKNKKITNDDVREILSVSRSVALDYLHALKKENKIKQNGKGRGIFYTKE